MLSHYATFALRLLRRSPAYSAITIGGFAIALASCILVLIFVRHELGYDAWLRDADELYRVHARLTLPGQAERTIGETPGPVYDRLVDDPDVAHAARMVYSERAPVFHGERSSFASVMLADPSVFDVLDFPVARGERGFPDPAACLVTEAFARKYFGDAEPLGGIVRLALHGRNRELRVTGVLRDLPVQTHFAFEVLGRLDPLDPGVRHRLDNWNSWVGYNYARLRPGADRAAIERRLAAAVAQHGPAVPIGGKLRPASEFVHLSLFPVRELHLYTTETDMRPPGDRSTLYAIAGVGVLLLLIAVANFINLTTARAARRAREIAIRKATGAQRRDIVVQYLGEAIVIALCALVVALMLVELALPWFEQLAARDLEPPHDPRLLAVLVVATAAIGAISGLYPAFVLARYQPAVVMNQNQASLAGGSGWLRSVLVFAQFAAAIGLAFGTTVVVRQAQYGAEANLGFAKRDRLVIHGIGSQVARGKRDAWLEQMRRLDGVERVALASHVPGEGTSRNTTLVSVPGEDRGGAMHTANIDEQYFANLAIAPLAGRTFSRDVALDDSTSAEAHPELAGRSVILNEAAIRRLGLGTPREAVGRELIIHVSLEKSASFRVIGVVPDVRFGSLRAAVPPLIYWLDRDGFDSAIVHYRPGSGQAVRGRAEALWTSLFAEQPFSAEFVDAAIDALYRTERRFAAILTTAALLALAVACLGLYGLASFLAESRKKELAIRKVLGASTSDIVRLLAWRLARPIALACLVAAPLAYLAASHWLSGFAYRIAIGPLWLVATITGAIAVAAATVAAQGLRAARATPIDTLRAE